MPRSTLVTPGPVPLFDSSVFAMSLELQTPIGDGYWKLFNVASGFQEDCNELIRRCTQVKKLSYEKFCNIWREMNFACIFYSNNSGAEIAEFTDEVLLIAKSFMFASTINFEESVAGVFLVYAILNLQPFVGFSPLKLIQEDVEYIQHIENIARSQRRYDVLYILGSILIKGPCQYHVAARERGLEPNIRKYLEEDYKDPVYTSKGVFSRQRGELELMGELKVLSTQYANLKKKLNDSGNLSASLKYTNDSIPQKLETSLKNIIFGTDKQGVPEKTYTWSDSPGSELASVNNVASIKQRAMKTTIQPIRHLTGLEERRIKNEPKSRTRKIQLPKKGFQTRTQKSASKYTVSSEESDSQISLHDSDSDGNSDRNETGSIESSPPRSKVQTKDTSKRNKAPSRIVYNTEDSGSEIHSDNSDSVRAGNSGETSTSEYIIPGNSDTVNLEVQTRTLPLLITASNEKNYEIEFIDQCDLENFESNNTHNIEVVPNSVQGSNVTDKNADNSGKDAGESSQKVLNIPRRREKRDYKNPKIASTFQRMGLLDMVKIMKKEKH